MTKFFKAIHKKTKEEIEFDKVIFYWSINGDEKEQEAHLKFSAISNTTLGEYKDYDVFYNHAGSWYPYGKEEE